MAAPYPVARLVWDQGCDRGRLRVVDDADVPPVGQLRRVDLVVAKPHLPLLISDVAGVALERIVHQLGGVEELLTAVDHLPFAVQTHVHHQRHKRGQDLGDAAAECGRREVENTFALERLGELMDLVHERAPDQARVIGEVLVGDGYGLEHLMLDAD